MSPFPSPHVGEMLNPLQHVPRVTAGLAQSFLQLLRTLDARIQVHLCCVGVVNTAADGSPRCCQLVLDTSSWQPLPWVFSDRGPEVPRRFVAQHCRCVALLAQSIGGFVGVVCRACGAAYM